MQRRYQVSERRACRIVGQHRSTQRYHPRRADQDAALSGELRRLARQHPAWGYKRAYKHLRRLGWAVNRKRVWRVWRESDLRATPTRRRVDMRALGSAENSIWNLPATRPNHVWAMDFKHDRTSDGRPYRILNVLDEYTRRSVACVVDRQITTRRVQEALERAFRGYGQPSVIRTDNGREFVAGKLGSWLAERGIDARAVERGRPQQNAYIETFHRTMGRDLLDWEKHDTLLEARTLITNWCKEYNRSHYHSSLADMTPNEFARACYQAHRQGLPIPVPPTPPKRIYSSS